MKRFFIFTTLLLLAFSLQAQDTELLKRIKEANSAKTSFESDLSNLFVKKGKKTSQEGKLYFLKPYRFTAQFTTGKYIIVNKEKIKMNIGLFHGTYRIKEGGMMQSLANIFLYGFQGRTQDLADENNYSLTTKTENGYHIITGTINKKKLLGLGYKQVIFKYHADSLLLKEIVLYDYSGNMDVYTMSNANYNVTVEPGHFEF